MLTLFDSAGWYNLIVLLFVPFDLKIYLIRQLNQY